MPIGTAVHDRTLALCESLNYREWSGYYAVSAYEGHHEHEYNAIRNATAVIDVSPLFKYLVTGRDAARFVDRLITRDVSTMAVGQVYYTPWCDEHGDVIDDGTVSRLSERTFRWTAADPSLRWFRQNAAGLDVVIDDVSEEYAALALQGPTSARVLQAASDADIRRLKYFRVTSGIIAGAACDISRTGYTGDLGYPSSVRVERDHASCPTRRRAGADHADASRLTSQMRSAVGATVGRRSAGRARRAPAETGRAGGQPCTPRAPRPSVGR